MEKTYHFAIDLGATSGRTILATFDGKKVAMQEISRFKNPMIPISGHLYWNLPGIYHEILLGLRKCKDTLEAISPMAKLATIGIDTWGCDVAFSTPTGRFQVCHIAIATATRKVPWKDSAKRFPKKRPIRSPAYSLWISTPCFSSTR